VGSHATSQQIALFQPLLAAMLAVQHPSSAVASVRRLMELDFLDSVNMLATLPRARHHPHHLSAFTLSAWRNVRDSALFWYKKNKRYKNQNPMSSSGNATKTMMMMNVVIDAVTATGEEMMIMMIMIITMITMTMMIIKMISILVSCNAHRNAWTVPTNLGLQGLLFQDANARITMMNKLVNVKKSAIAKKGKTTASASAKDTNTTKTKNKIKLDITIRSKKEMSCEFFVLGF